MELINKQTGFSTLAEDVPETSLHEFQENPDEALFIQETILDAVTQGGGSIPLDEPVTSRGLTTCEMEAIESEAEFFYQRK